MFFFALFLTYPWRAALNSKRLQEQCFSRHLGTEGAKGQPVLREVKKIRLSAEMVSAVCEDPRKLEVQLAQ